MEFTDKNAQENLGWKKNVVLYLHDIVFLLILIMLIFLLPFRIIVVSGDSMEYLKSVREQFDIIFLDPPYEAGLLEPAIAHIAKFDILSPHGIIVAEHPANRTLPALAEPYRLHRTYRYGKIGLTVYRRGANEKNEE